MKPKPSTQATRCTVVIPGIGLGKVSVMKQNNPEYLRGRIELLEGFIHIMGRICFNFMPPSGQDDMQKLQDDFFTAQEEWREKCDVKVEKV